MTPINSKSFLALKAEIESYQRPCGYYLINLVDITGLRQSGCIEEEMIDTIFQYFNDHKWPPKEQRPQDLNSSNILLQATITQ